MRIPSLDTLRAFEAAGRLQSYSAAGAELGLTHSAVSRRIRDLEQQTAKRLFSRQGNRMVPTTEGKRLLGQVRAALDLLTTIFPRGAPQETPLRISVFPSLALRWLAPRLAEFRAQFPDIDCALHLSSDVVGLSGGREGAIRYGDGTWSGTHSRLLRRETLIPVCAPTYQAAQGIAGWDDLARCRLLRHPWTSWAAWLGAVGATLPALDEGPEYSDSSLLLDAAEAGEGVALARRQLVEDALRSGRLVRPVPGEAPDRYAYYFVRAAAPPAPALLAFADWLADALAQ